MKNNQKAEKSDFPSQENDEKEKGVGLIFENYPTPTFLLKLNGVIEEINEAACEIIGYEKEEIIGGRILEAPFLTAKSREKVREKLEKRLKGERIEPYRLEIRTKGNQKRILKIKTRLLLEGERILGVLGTARDITRQTKRRERDDFLHSLLSHDLRNKAQIIQGYHGLLKNLEIPEKGEEYLERADETVRDSIDLIEKVRSLRKVGEEELKEFKIGSLIDSIASEYEARGLEQRLIIENGECDCTVRAGKLMKEVFTNLIENSINHSDGSKIKISCEKGAEGCIITVEDDGKGIPDDEKEKIFERGYKSGESGGSGLGMYLVEEIAESYGGSVEVKDSELGGARFDVRLPKA